MSKEQREQEYNRIKGLLDKGHKTIQMPESLRKEFEKPAPPPKVEEKKKTFKKKVPKPTKSVEKKEEGNGEK